MFAVVETILKTPSFAEMREASAKVPNLIALNTVKAASDSFSVSPFNRYVGVAHYDGSH